MIYVTATQNHSCCTADDHRPVTNSTVAAQSRPSPTPPPPDFIHMTDWSLLVTLVELVCIAIGLGNRSTLCHWADWLFFPLLSRVHSQVILHWDRKCQSLQSQCWIEIKSWGTEAFTQKKLKLKTKVTRDYLGLDTLKSSPLAEVAMGSLITHIHRQAGARARIHAHTFCQTHTHTHSDIHRGNIYTRKKRRKVALSTNQSVPHPVWLFFMDYRSLTMGHSSNKPSLWTTQPNKLHTMD